MQKVMAETKRGRTACCRNRVTHQVPTSSAPSVRSSRPFVCEASGGRKHPTVLLVSR